MSDLNLNIYDGMYIDPKEFFDKTRDMELELERLIYDNQRVRLKQHIDGYEFKCLLSGIKEEIEAEEEYITIFKEKNCYLIRHMCYDYMEETVVVNGWRMVC
ncbi:hypothetical protein [Clostridium perfringens]|uniref:hypothetical protein n=1 Tax=Clostridium perfringens TaxID=1502 RepID=UPI0039EB5ACE|nr:hypothetical protein [Clostridium perfringens]